MNPDYKWKAKAFLEKRLNEYDKKIIKMKRKRKAIKVAFVFCISLSIVSSTVCASLTALIPPVAISVLTASGALAAAVSLKFNLKGKKEELNAAICKLERIRKNIDYFISCNGDFTEKEFKEIVANC